MNQHDTYKLLDEAIYRADVDDVSLRSYSGRGMYGRECIGLDGSQSDILKVLFKAAVMNPEVFEDNELDEISWDSMGLGAIAYWRHVPAEGIDFPEDN